MLCFAVVAYGLSSHISASAQELDSARQAYRAIASCLGLSFSDFGSSNTAVLDTSAELPNLLNAGGRQVVLDWPYVATDTITIATNTFVYSLNTNFTEDSVGPYTIFGISKKGDRIYNVPIRSAGEFNVQIGAPGLVFGARIIGRSLFIFPAAPAGDKLYVFGPGDWVPVTASTSLLTAAPENRLWGAVYWAAMKIAANRSDDVKVAENEEAYARHILARRAGGP